MAGAATRSAALDVFRGATVAGMILVNNPGSWQHLYPPLAHAPWHGWTATDLVFPFFLVAVGLSLALVTPGLLAGAAAAFWRKWLLRGLGLVAIGLALNALSLPRFEAGQFVLRGWSDWRLMGVLQRIGLAWMAAAALVWWLRARVPAVAAVVAALLVGYAALCLGLGAPGDPYSLEGFFGTALDRAALGPRHLYQGEGVPFDPEGLASTLPAVAQVLLGWLAGCWLLPVLAVAPGAAAAAGAAQVAQAANGHGSDAAALARQKRVLVLALAALLLLALAQAWAQWVPINKKLWTPPYALHTSGLALLLLGALVLALPPDGRGAGTPGVLAASGPTGLRRIWAACVAFAQAYGRNALAVFVLSGLVPRLLALVRVADGADPATGAPRSVGLLAWVYRTVFAPMAADPRLGSLAMALVQVAAYGALALWMDRRRLYLRL